MSALMYIAQEATVQAATAGTPMAAGEGIIGTLTDLNLSVQDLFRAVAVTAGIGFVVWAGIASAGRMSRILVAIAVAGIAVWGVFNITTVKDKVDKDINASGPVVVIDEANTASRPEA